MALQMVDLEVRLPERGRASRSFSAKKPMAEVSCILEDGRSREIVVPVRVARTLLDESIGLPLGEVEAFDAIHALEERACLATLMEMLSRRDHSVQEAVDKLALYGYRPQEIDSVISRGVKSRYLDDERFAQYFIEARKSRGWGRRKIEIELKRRGIQPQDLPGYPDEYFPGESEMERACEIVERASIPSSRPFDKLVRKLMNKGFSYAIASQAVRRRIEEAEELEF